MQLADIERRRILLCATRNLEVIAALKVPAYIPAFFIIPRKKRERSQPRRRTNSHTKPPWERRVLFGEMLPCTCTLTQRSYPRRREKGTTVYNKKCCNPVRNRTNIIILLIVVRKSVSSPCSSSQRYRSDAQIDQHASVRCFQAHLALSVITQHF